MTESPWRPVFRVKIPCIPAGQPRPRLSVKTSKTGKSFASVYNPTTTKTKDGRKTHPSILFKAAILAGVKQVYRGPVIDGPVRFDLTAVFPRPKSMVWKTRPMPRVPHDVKPDFDNLEKCASDPLTGFVWKDDCKITSSHTDKFIASGDEEPHVVIAVYEWIGT